MDNFLKELEAENIWNEADGPTLTTYCDETRYDLGVLLKKTMNGNKVFDDDCKESDAETFKALLSPEPICKKEVAENDDINNDEDSMDEETKNGVVDIRSIFQMQMQMQMNSNKDDDDEIDNLEDMTTFVDYYLDGASTANSALLLTPSPDTVLDENEFASHDQSNNFIFPSHHSPNPPPFYPQQQNFFPFAANNDNNNNFATNQYEQQSMYSNDGAFCVPMSGGFSPHEPQNQYGVYPHDQQQHNSPHFYPVQQQQPPQRRNVSQQQLQRDSHRRDPPSIKEIISHNLSLVGLIENHLICAMINDQEGSRHLQSKLRSCNESEMTLFTMHLIDVHMHNNANNHATFDIVKCSEDVFGNYIIQLLFLPKNERNFERLLESFIYPNCLKLSQSMHGCRVIQKALSCVKDINLLCKLVNCLREQAAKNHNLHELLICVNTNHVIQAMINLSLPYSPNLLFIKEELERNLTFYAEHKYGCRIVQCFIKTYGDKLNICSLFGNDNHMYLAQLQFGNYVIQCCIECNEWYSNLKMINKFRNQLIDDVFSSQHISYLSKNKFGSNVVEKCIKVSNYKQLNLLISTLASNSLIIPQMVKHCYGNYVIKTLLRACDTKQQIKVIKSINYYCPKLLDIDTNQYYYYNHKNTNCDYKYSKELIKEINRINFNLDEETY